MRGGLKALVFDKDGTLFDFEKTWGRWAVAFLTDLAGGDAVLAEALAAEAGVDLERARFRTDSVVIARGLAVRGDVADDDDCRRIVAEAAEAFGRLDVLINSAGTTVFVPHHDLEGITRRRLASALLREHDRPVPDDAGCGSSPEGRRRGTRRVDLVGLGGGRCGLLAAVLRVEGRPSTT